MTFASVQFPPELPISARVDDIARAIAQHSVVIVAGETGSGKTTQLPKICLAMGRGERSLVGVTQPRRIAATSVATRVAGELSVELGREVGYQIRFANRTSRATRVKFMTDGILLAELTGDRLLRGYDTLILDEAHERTLNIDFLLGYVKQLVPRRPDLRVVISSATLEVERFAAFFGGAPIIQVSGRTFPVEVIHRPPTQSEPELSETVANVVEELTELDPREDILVFLPGEREIHEAEDVLNAHALPHTTVLPLYGRLSQAEQQRVFAPATGRRVVLSTNVAETSLTIPGIVYVVDAGLARINRYNARTGVTQLLVEPISRASADQRKGRAGRTQSGVCFRLYDADDDAGRPAFTDPEILRIGLAGVILQMKSLGLGEIEHYPFLDPPPKRAIDEGYRVLDELGAVDEHGHLTEIGRKLSKLPVDPRIGRMILSGEEQGALQEVLVLAAALGLPDPRDRPRSAQARADEAHRKFRAETSDFLSLLQVWRAWVRCPKTQSQQRKLCRDNFLSYVRMREWADVHMQLARIAIELDFKLNAAPASDEAIHRAILPGLLSRVAMWQPEKRVYLGARQTRFQIHPSSGLARKPPAWIIAAELVETSQLFARTVAKIDPAWLEAAAGPLCRRSFGDPHWEQRPAQVMVKEQVTLYGLPIVRDRKTHYGPIDPVAARRIFIVHALVRREYAGRAPFQEHNERLFDEVRRLRDKARRGDMLADDEGVADFFDRRIPEGVYSGKTFETWRAAAEAIDPRVLFLSLADVLQGEEADLSPERFPDEITLHGARLPLSYRFDPSADDDGVTVTLPLGLLPAADPAVFEWTIPAWHATKIELLFESLPKAARKALAPLAATAAEIASELAAYALDVARPSSGDTAAYEQTPMLQRLAQAIYERTDLRVATDAFALAELPPYLRLYFRLVDGGKVLAEGRSLSDLKARFGGRAAAAWTAKAAAEWEREGLTAWSFDELPAEVQVRVGGQALRAFPALVDTGAAVSVRPMPSRFEADEATRGGMRRLVLLQMRTTLPRIEAQFAPSLARNGLVQALLSRHPGGPAPLGQLALRALDEAFGLLRPSTFPRTRSAFEERLATGKLDLPGAIAELGRLVEPIGAELVRAEHGLRALDGKPGAPRAQVDDVRAQLAELLPRDLLGRASRDRLGHLPRYLRGIQLRLERLPNGPDRDRAKAEQVLPFWRDFLEQRDSLRARGVPDDELDAFRWLVEEFRVSLFAPELRAATVVSAQRLREAWQSMGRR